MHVGGVYWGCMWAGRTRLMPRNSASSLCCTAAQQQGAACTRLYSNRGGACTRLHSNSRGQCARGEHAQHNREAIDRHGRVHGRGGWGLGWGGSRWREHGVAVHVYVYIMCHLSCVSGVAARSLCACKVGAGVKAAPGVHRAVWGTYGPPCRHGVQGRGTEAERGIGHRSCPSSCVQA